MYRLKFLAHVGKSERLGHFFIRLNQNQQIRCLTRESAYKDPFGLADEDPSEIQNVIKGVYSPHHPLGRASAEFTKDDTNTDSQSHQENGTLPPEEKFKNLVLSPVEREILKDSSKQKVYSSHFGEIRLDSDNAVKIDGQFDPEYKEIDEFDANSSSMQRLSDSMKEYPEESEGPRGFEGLDMLSHQIRQRHPLKNHWKSPSKPDYIRKRFTIEGEEEATVEAKDKVVEKSLEPPAPEISKTLESPATAAEYLKLKRMKESSAKKSVGSVGGKKFELPESFEPPPVKHLPDVYLPFDYDSLTHDDVWSIIAKRVCFQNDFLIAINKPAGLPMHTPSVGCRHTIIEFLPEMAKIANVPQIFPCHRLDKDTTGILLFAKSEAAADVIRNKFKTRTIEKQYFAITKNCPEIREATISIPIGIGTVGETDVVRRVLKPDLQAFKVKSNQKSCKEAITKYRVLSSQPWAALIDCRPVTGVTHQIRVHLSRGLGCPVLGDHKFSHREKMAPQRLHDEMLDRLKIKQSKVRRLPLHLHCSKMEFTMPDGFMKIALHEPVFIHARPPAHFLHTLRVLGLKN